MPLIIKQFDTYPPWVMTLADEEGWIPLTTANGVKFIAQLVGGSTTIGPVSCSPLAEQAFTGTTTAGSTQISSVSAFTGITEGSTITGPNIDVGSLVTDLDATHNILTISKPALGAGTGTSMVANRGMVSYTPLSADTATIGLFNCECAIHWDAAGLVIQKVPNTKAANPQLQIDPDILGVVE